MEPSTTKACPFCHQLTATTDRYCRQCGRNIEPPMAAPSTRAKQPMDVGMQFLIGVLGLVLAVGAVMAILSIVNGSRPAPALPPGTVALDPFDAYSMCQDFVIRRLKAPSNAEFASYSDKELTQVSYIGGRSFQVDSFVDAENSFGAKLRIAFVCKVTNTGGENWRLDKLTTSEN